MVISLRRPMFVPTFVLVMVVLLLGMTETKALNFQTLYKFPAPPRNPDHPLTVGKDGSLYGITTGGGTNDTGTFFKISPNGTYKQLASFGEQLRVTSRLIFGPDGNLYGTAAGTSTNDFGSIFRLTTNGVLKTIFTTRPGTSVAYPQHLLLGKDKNLYFTAYTTNSGALARISLTGVVTIVATNDLLAGVPMMQGRDNHFYGVAPANINHDETLFKVTLAGVVSTVLELNSFDNLLHDAALVQTTAGLLYGVTLSGGDFDQGRLFAVTTNGIFTNLYSFASPPTSPLVVLNDVIYGGTMTNIFKVINNQVTNFVSFASSVQVAGLNFGRDGNLYCTAFYGGTNNAGAIITITQAGAITNVRSFEGSQGSKPASEMTLAADGFLYGTTTEGGTNNSGAIFKISSSGLFSSLLSFEATDGSHQGGLVQTEDELFYGTTPVSASNQHGSIFRFIPDNSLETIATFDGTNGSFPTATMVQGANGKLYGVTSNGGGTSAHPAPLPLAQQTIASAQPSIYNSGRGTVFAVSTNGDLTTLVRFDGTNGATPSAKLVSGNDGNFYGTTFQGGNDDGSGLGTVFKVTPEGDLTTLAHFFGTNGSNPSGLTLANDGNFYGTTEIGGKANAGTVFKMASDGTLTTLFSFAKTNGENPHQIIQATNGKLYGTTANGGKYKRGTLYELTTNGLLTILTHFAWTNGAAPLAALTELPDGSLCGVTAKGGNGAGVIFRYGKVPPTIVTQPLSRTNALHSTATFTVKASGPTPYTYQWLKNGTPITNAKRATLTLLNVSYSSAGTYSVIVSNLDGFTVSSNATLTIAPPPLIVSQPESQTATVGTTVSFSVSASSLLPLAYQWQFKGVALPGKTAPTLTLTNIQTGKAGGYRVLVKNGSGAVLSSNAVLTVQTCTYDLATNIIYIGAAGGSASVAVTADHDDCTWLAANTNAWITLTSPVANTGSTNVTFNVSSNQNNVVRVGTILAAGSSFLVIQEGTPAPGAINGKILTFRVDIGAGSDFQMMTSLVGNNYLRLPTNSVPKTYNYQRNSGTSATLTLTQAGTFQLTFDTLTTGSYVYVSTNSNVGTGTFTVSETRPDYNNDGSPDLLWESTFDGSLRVSYMRGTNYLQSRFLQKILDNKTAVVGQADLNGDGTFDLLTQDSSGFVKAYYMVGTNFVGNNLLNFGNAVDTAWRIVALRDMNNDGKADILWQHSGGALWLWTMDGINQTGSFVIRNGVSPGASWKVVAVADFNGDGQNDIFFLNDAGHMAIWYMNGTTYLTGGGLNIAPLATIWRIVGSYDYDADGKTDLLLEDTGGNLVVWLMNGVERNGGFALDADAPESIWRIVGPR